MKRNTPDHWKTEMLMLELGIGLAQAVGHLELLFHLTSKQTPHGDIGKVPNSIIAKRCGWEGNADQFIIALIKCGWIDESNEHRMVVHDWHEHCDDATKKAVTRSNRKFASTTEDRQCRTMSDMAGDNVCLPEPSLALAKPLPLPLPEPEPEPAPVAAAATAESEFENYQITDFVPPRQSDFSVLDRFPEPLRPQIIAVAVEYCMRRYGGSKHHEPWYKDLLNEIGAVLEVQPDSSQAVRRLVETCKQVKDQQLLRTSPFSDIAIYCELKPARGQIRSMAKSQAESEMEKSMHEAEERMKSKNRPAVKPPTPPPRQAVLANQTIKSLAKSMTSGVAQ